LGKENPGEVFVMNFKVFAKCILSGEHAVIRGSPALVYPVKQKFLEVNWNSTVREFSADFEGEMKDDLSFVFWGVLEKGLKLVGKKHSDLYGRLYINNTVPVGAGLGASATLCVGVGRFFEALGFLNDAKMYEFCRQLENLFHGESSGVDIAATLTGVPIQFQRPHLIEKLHPVWNPHFYLSYSGQRGMTAECVRIVKELFVKDEKLATKVDLEMKESVLQMRAAFLKPESDGLIEMIEAVNKANTCFSKWGLTHGVLGEEIEKMRSFGALAAKPTGSGRGGYVLSLWKETPPEDIRGSLIQL
jgi:mevalonate kinase